MNAIPEFDLDSDRGSSSALTGQEHAGKFFIKRVEDQFADKSVTDLEEACQQALRELGPGAGRDHLEARAREILSSL